MILIAVLQYIHNKFIQGRLEEEIEEARAAFEDPETYKKMSAAAILAMRKTLHSKWFQTKKTLRAIIGKTKGKKKAWYMALGEVLMSPKGKRMKMAAKNIEALTEPLRREMEAAMTEEDPLALTEEQQKKMIEAQAGILTPTQKKKLAAAQEKILTKEQKEAIKNAKTN